MDPPRIPALLHPHQHQHIHPHAHPHTHQHPPPHASDYRDPPNISESYTSGHSEHDIDVYKPKKRKRPSIHEDLDDVYHDMDSILSQKRKPRNKTACVPCRKRKVGCDKTTPCQTCVERRHPEICVYESTSEHGGNSFVSVVSPTLSEQQVSVPKSYLETLMNKVDRLESTMKDLRQEIRNGKEPVIDPMISSKGRTCDDTQRREGIHTNNPLTGQSIHVGGNSVPALIMSLAKHSNTFTHSEDGAQLTELVDGSVLPLLGLANESATYPFIDLWSIPEDTVAKIRKMALFLPSNEEINRLWESYKTISYVLFPALGNITKFEKNLEEFLLRRSQKSVDEDMNDESIHGKKTAWLGLLFAVLASGCHFTKHIDRSKREMTSKIYVCFSFECLRMTNFLSNPTLESIQSLAVFLNVIANMYNAGVSWAMLGLAIRLAQSMGLHRNAPASTPFAVSEERSRIWWALIWQDAIISVTYDRAGYGVSSNYDETTHLPPSMMGQTAGSWDFTRCMYEICNTILGIVRERLYSKEDLHSTLLKMSHFEKEVSQIYNSAAPNLRDSNQCITKEEKIQYWLLSLHHSYVLCELYRPALSPGAPQTDLVTRMRANCIDHLSRVVRGWLGWFQVEPLTHRSWPAMHRALSSALLLGVIRETKHDYTIRTLLLEFLRTLEETTADMNDQAIHAPLSRTIYWLRKLVRSEDNSDNSTSSPCLPEVGSEDSPHAFIERLMWSGYSTTPTTVTIS